MVNKNRSIGLMRDDNGIKSSKRLYGSLLISVGIAIGGGVRIGLEDNIWYDSSRTKLARNIDLIKRIHVIAEANEREIMTATEFRKKMNLEPGNGKYARNNK